MKMNQVSRWDPFRELEELSEQLNQVFGRPRSRRRGDREAIATSDWTPLVDVIEKDKEYLIKTELTEVKKDQVKVIVKDGVLTIQGERKADDDKSKRYHRMERPSGTFLRSFTVPDDVDETKVSAEFKNGVLSVCLPKAEKAKPRTVEIKVS